ncbi:flagellar motor switch protein FliM [Maritimibacter sp. HL-12]|uniref:flagellar motor switch protein FliM n=1 Tax=Maritimibacter sp. HL-12 TaxID=1162418 RepID=UPI000A0EEE82|nr:flagellar motor switch protein FliM [Maritimibacter sp. HL-12]SMH31850.1 flagellar motor switch protein FliM [Maritimibacter sp. HL-12]
MREQNQPSAMRRKAGAGRPPPEIGQITPAKALRTAVAQAAEDVAALVATSGAVDEARVTLEAIGEDLPEHPLLALVEGPGGGFGLVVLDAQAVAALIEMQTTGRVVPRPAEARAPTRTDAILCADFIDRMLEVFEQRVGEAGLGLAPAITGYRYAMALAEARAVVLTLEDTRYRRLTFPVDFGRGAKTGLIQIILPHDAPESGTRRAADAGVFTEALQAQVMAAKAVLSATLTRRRMTLAELASLTVGSEITLPADALADVGLEDLAGRQVARGRLGQVAGHRALRLTLASAPGAPLHDPRPPDSRLPAAAAGPALSPPGGLAALTPRPAAEPDALAPLGSDFPSAAD